MSDLDDRLSAAVDSNPDADPYELSTKVVDQMSAPQRRTALIRLVADEIDMLYRIKAHRIEQEARQLARHPDYGPGDPDVFVRLHQNPALWSVKGGVWFGSSQRRNFASWCRLREGKRNGFDTWLTRALAEHPEDEDFRLDWVPGYHRDQVGNEVAKMINEVADRIRFETTAELLNTVFATGDGTRVSWRDATVAQHEERVDMLTKMIAGTSETAAMHIAAVRMIKDAGVETLGHIVN